MERAASSCLPGGCLGDWRPDAMEACKCALLLERAGTGRRLRVVCGGRGYLGQKQQRED